MNLIILGNGFDQSYKIDTSPKSFFEYLKAIDSDCYDRINILYDNKGESWNDFESHISDISVDKIRILNSMGITPKNIYENFKRAFVNWLNDVVLVESKAKLEGKSLYSFMNTNDKFINFNYINSLISLKVTENNIFHIHGEVSEYIKAMKIFGLYNDYDSIILGCSKKEKCNDKLLDEFYGIFEKKVNKIIEMNINKIKFFCKDIKKIIIFGFSCSKVDMPYIQEIVEYANVDVDIYCYDNVTYENATIYKNIIKTNKEIKLIPGAKCTIEKE